MEQSKQQETFNCVLCQETFKGKGNDSRPMVKNMKHNVCCDECNQYVVEHRIRSLMNKCAGCGGSRVNYTTSGRKNEMEVHFKIEPVMFKPDGKDLLYCNLCNENHYYKGIENPCLS